MQPTLYLASASPRRRELLGQLGLRCTVQPTNVDEEAQPNEPPGDYVERLAVAKAAAVRSELSTGLVIAADTAVVVNGKLLGKPACQAEAQAMLLELSGRTHEVFTGVAITNGERCRRAVQCSSVAFRPITASEAEAYWATGEPADKAGAYAIQGLAAIFIETLHGSYSGVMGLPLFETAQLLAEFGVAVMPVGAAHRE